MEEAEDRLKEYQHKKDDTNYWVVFGELQNQSVDNIKCSSMGWYLRRPQY